MKTRSIIKLNAEAEAEAESESESEMVAKSAMSIAGTVLNPPFMRSSLDHHHHHHEETKVPTSEIDDTNDGEGDNDFDASVMPPFSIAQVRAAIPAHCWLKSSSRSCAYFAIDVAVVACLACLASLYFHSSSLLLWPLYWFAQGTMFWALFVIGHDCGHGSFSDSRTLNNIVGHMAHSFILVPFHGWRISHRTHHQNHGNVEKDESWHPLSENIYRNLSETTRIMRFTLPWQLFAFPIYLACRSPGKEGSHFNPDSRLFDPNERTDVLISTLCWVVMFSILVAVAVVMGPTWILKLYVVPYWVFVAWLDLVTYLHHHGHDKKVAWYRNKEWSYLRGGLSTIDRDYGIFNKIHHDIGTHVVHHLFPQIPHYHLVEATEAVKPVLGKYYREPKKSGILPIHLAKPLLKSLSEDHYVKDGGDVVFYETDPTLYGPLDILKLYMGSNRNKAD